jgi:antitoxin ParD1/3/4
VTRFVIQSGLRTEDPGGIAMNVSLTPELEEFVGTKAGSGRYNSASEVVREALRLLEEHDQARAAQLTELNRELGRRLASLDRGETVDPAESRAELRRKSQERRTRKA